MTLVELPELVAAGRVANGAGDVGSRSRTPDSWAWLLRDAILAAGVTVYLEAEPPAHARRLMETLGAAVVVVGDDAEPPA